jgi:hypothetical protein
MSGASGVLRDLMVLMAPDGRFAVLGRDQLMAHVEPVSSVEDVLGAMFRFMSAQTWLSEAEARVELTGLGLTAPAIDEAIASARRKLEVMSSQPTVMERITRVGYCNRDGQEVIRRTDVRAGDQRVFVLRCGVCGHEYGSYGCDADIRRCPRCQDGPPGVTSTEERR